VNDTSDHDTTDDGGIIPCPWCGASHGDLFEHRLGDGDTVTVDCDGCGKQFELSCAITVDYHASREVPS